MKINEVTLNEGPMDWLARKGFLGKNKQITAVGKQLGKERTAMSAAASANLEARGKDEFLRGLQSSLVKGEGAGLISAGTSSSGMPVSSFLEKYVGNLIKNLQIPAGVDLTNLYTEFQNTYQGGGRLPQAAEKLWNAVGAIKSVSQEKEAGGQQIEPPSENIDFTDAFQPASSTSWKYSYDDASKTWTRWPKASTNPASVATPLKIGPTHQLYNKLNAAYQREGL